MKLSLIVQFHHYYLMLYDRISYFTYVRCLDEPYDCLLFWRNLLKLFWLTYIREKHGWSRYNKWQINLFLIYCYYFCHKMLWCILYIKSFVPLTGFSFATLLRKKNKKWYNSSHRGDSPLKDPHFERVLPLWQLYNLFLRVCNDKYFLALFTPVITRHTLALRNISLLK